MVSEQWVEETRRGSWPAKWPMTASITILLGLLLGASQAAEPKLPATLNLESLRALPIQHDGRWPPLDTLARDVVETVTGSAAPNGHDPVLLLLAWTFDAENWRNAPLISIRNAELRAELELPAGKATFSFTELVNHAPLQELIDKLSQGEAGRKLDPLETKASDLNEKLSLLNRVFTGGLIRVVPDPNSASGAWKPPAAAKRGEAEKGSGVDAAWVALRTAFVADDGPAFATAADQFATALAALPTKFRPAPEVIATELRYNQLRPFRLAWQVMLAGTALALLAMWVRRRWFDVLAVLGLLAGFAVLSYGLWLRWQVAGRIPASNMFESLLFVGWGVGAFAILAMLVQRQRAVPLTASAMGAIALLLADFLPLDHFVRPIAPVLLDTVWMSIHVPIIMVSYSVLALGVLFAHGQVLALAIVPRRRGLIDTIDALHYWYIHVGSLLLLAGIVTGSMWAASSWGRYWGWDPKEVWSLVAFLGYLAIMHVRIDRERIPGWMYGVAALLAVGLFAAVLTPLRPLTSGNIGVAAAVAATMALFVLARGQFATALKSILAFWLIIMTYVGVNFVLGSGLHSYGFGTGAVARYMFLSGGIDLGLVALCCLIYLARGRSYPVLSGQPIAPPA